jgi:hemerythrin-like metal-binding protein
MFVATQIPSHLSMTNRQLDPYELGGASLELDVEESDYPGDYWEFQKLAERQNMQFADTTTQEFFLGEPPAPRSRAKYPVTPDAPSPGLPRKFRAALTGIAAMDFEHDQLLLQLERTFHAPDLPTAHAALEKFIKAWSLHHLHEEQHMRAKFYPDVEVHKAQHDRLLEKYQFVRNEAMHSEAELDSVKAYVEIVAKMVTDHILRSDMLYVRWGNSQRH